MNDTNLALATPSDALAANISSLANTTGRLMNSSKWLNENDVISNFRWVAPVSFLTRQCVVFTQCAVLGEDSSKGVRDAGDVSNTVPEVWTVASDAADWVVPAQPFMLHSCASVALPSWLSHKHSVPISHFIAGV
jgi:hypothetical protein